MTTTPDHQMTPEIETSTPAEDHPSTSTTKITEPITPRHHDPVEINFSVTDAPSQWIRPAVGGQGAWPGGDDPATTPVAPLGSDGGRC